MSHDKVLEIVQDAVMATLITSAPPLLLGLVVGLVVSVFQAVTSIQEQTLAFVPKIAAVLLSLILFGGFMLGTMQDFIINLYSQIPDLLGR
ncbi:MAG: flagellar biosynthesis protein FliQ [Clostridiales bacterium]|jgi:flagellar biosynthetic protein FliQ|nr:flagellar biosynthesis protein FliQ [Clostridiales bacterium]